MKLQALSSSFLSYRFRFLVLVAVALAGLAPSSSLRAEDCIPFATEQAQIRVLGGRLKIVSGNKILLDFGSSRTEALQALRVIQHYGLNSQCFVGRPNASLEYYLVDGQTPRGPLAGEDSIAFDPERLQIRRIGGRIKIVDGNHAMLDFGASVREAREALFFIRKYGFNRICFVGRPDPSMVYFRADVECEGPALRDVSLESRRLTINGDRVRYKAVFGDDCGVPVDAVVQTWVEQGETLRAAGGVRVDCQAGGTCTEVFTIGANDDRARGEGQFVPGPAVAVFELKVNGRIVSERRLPVELVRPCSGASLTDVLLESDELTINGDRVRYKAAFGDDCGVPVDAVVQTWVEQGETLRAAGGVRVDCQAGGTCTEVFTIGANDDRARGEGQFVPGPAVAVFELKVNGRIVSERRLPVTLLLEEDCVSFDFRRLRVVRVNGSYKIVEGRHSLMDFGTSRDEAVRAFQILRHYRMDSMCFVGRPDPSMQYFLVEGEAPRGPLAGEDALAFDPERLEVRRLNGSFKLVDGNHLLLDFGASLDEARTALEIIQEYGFNRICFVGRPDPSMMYFRIAEENEALDLPSFVRGDADGSGSVAVNDGMVLSQVLFLGDSTGAPCRKALDANDSGEVGFDDLIHLYQFLFTSGAPPAAPFPACGVDPTDDRLSCEGRCD